MAASEKSRSSGTGTLWLSGTRRLYLNTPWTWGMNAALPKKRMVRQ